MAETHRIPVFGVFPPCFLRSRLSQIGIKPPKKKRIKQNQIPGKVLYYDFEGGESPIDHEQILKTSHNFVDYLRSREYDTEGSRTVKPDYATRQVLMEENLKECPINLDKADRIYCSQWIGTKRVILGTGCNRLLIYDVAARRSGEILTLAVREDENSISSRKGIRSVRINPSASLLATNGKYSNEIALYRLPICDPICIGKLHEDCVLDLYWLDDEFLVSGSSCRRKQMALWRIADDVPASSYREITPIVSKKCKAAKEHFGFAFNRAKKELAALSCDSNFHIWDVELFKQKLTRKFFANFQPVCTAINDDCTLYVIGGRSVMTLADSRSTLTVRKISIRDAESSILSCSVHNNIVTIGTSRGVIMFYDLRSLKYLFANASPAEKLTLEASRGYISKECTVNFDLATYKPGIYTHCYDSSGTRLFCAGGPYETDVKGNYASIWQ